MRDRVSPFLVWPPAVVGIVALACVLAAPVHDLMVLAGGLPGPGARAEYGQDFLKVLRRLVLIPLAALFLWWNRPWRGELRRYGLRPTRARLRAAALGFALAVALLTLVLAWQLRAGWLAWEQPLRLGKFAGRVARYLGVGVLIALVEEWFFRGWLAAFAERHHGRVGAVVLPCLAYGVVHAFRASTAGRAVSHDARGAWDAIAGWLAFATDLRAFGPALLGLFLFAVLLTALYRRTGSLWPSIGVHAGGVLVLASYGALTQRSPEPTWVGTRLLYDSPVVWAVLVLATLGLWPRRPPGAASGDGPAAEPPAAG